MELATTTGRRVVGPYEIGAALLGFNLGSRGGSLRGMYSVRSSGGADFGRKYGRFYAIKLENTYSIRRQNLIQYYLMEKYRAKMTAADIHISGGVFRAVRKLETCG